MKSRLDDVPALRIADAEVDAAHYNRVRLALLRLGSPLRLTLPDLRGLDMLLDETVWICVDRTNDDLPVLAWTDFQGRGRSGLHQPVACRLRYFHAHADDIIEMVLEDIDRLLAERLGESTPRRARRVTPLPWRPDKS